MKLSESKSFKELLEKHNLPERCLLCSGCQYVNQIWSPACPSYEENRLQSYYLGGRLMLAWGLEQGKIKWSKSLAESLYKCTLGANCVFQCRVADTDGTFPMREAAMAVLEKLRREAVEEGFGPMPAQKECGEHIAKEHNPYMEPHKDRLKWVPKDMELPEEAENVYFVGCTASYKVKEVALATAQVLKKLGVNFTIMKDEWCSGSLLLRTGQWDIAVEQTKHNLEEFEKTGAKTMIISDSEAYKTWKQDWKGLYKDILGVDYNFKVMHITELLASLIKEGKVKFKGDFKKKVTYHDPCFLGRYSGIYDEPRIILENIPGIGLIEMERNRENAWCCGSCGGVKFAFPDFASHTAKKRLVEAEETGAEALVSSCPISFEAFNDAIQKYGSKLELYDITQIFEKVI